MELLSIDHASRKQILCEINIFKSYKYTISAITQLSWKHLEFKFSKIIGQVKIMAGSRCYSVATHQFLLFFNICNTFLVVNAAWKIQKLKNVFAKLGPTFLIMVLNPESVSMKLVLRFKNAVTISWHYQSLVPVSRLCFSIHCLKMQRKWKIFFDCGSSLTKFHFFYKKNFFYKTKINDLFKSEKKTVRID